MEARRLTLEKESAAFVNSDKPGTRSGRSNLNQAVTTSVRLPETDKLLEDILVSDISISVPLTKRESQILKLILSGKTNREMAQMLSIAKRTVDYHRNQLMHKLNVHNVANLVKRAIAIGIA